jgi:predicted nucleic acid-binding protein
MNVLVDTSVWSLALRRKAHDLSTQQQWQVKGLSELIAEGRAKLIGLIRQELLSGIKTTAQFEKLREFLHAFRDEPVSTPDFETAARVGNECRAKGIVVSTVDILICAVALRRSLLVYTTDPDFKNYARVLPLKFHPITEKPAGS